MSDEYRAPEPIWTLEAWIEHSRELDRERQRALDTLEKAAEKALDLAAENQKLRDEAHNEILKKWQEERASFATKTELRASEDKIAIQIQPLTDFRSNTYGQREGRLDVRTLIISLSALMVGVCGVIAAVIVH
jgi:hypothetical protein